MERPVLDGGLVVKTKNLEFDLKITTLNSSTSVELNSAEPHRSLRSLDEGPSEPMIIARKGNQFRTVIERKLGVDMEH